MVNIIWVLLTVIGILFAMINGTMEEVNEAVFKGASGSSHLLYWLN